MLARSCLRRETTVGTWQGLPTTAYTAAAIAISSIHRTHPPLPTPHVSCQKSVSRYSTHAALFSPFYLSYPPARKALSPRRLVERCVRVYSHVRK